MSAVSSANQSASQLPVIDIQGLLAEKGGQDAVVDSIIKACESTGFFYIKTGVSSSLIARLELGANRFFSKSIEEKEKSTITGKKKRAMKLRMSLSYVIMNDEQRKTVGCPSIAPKVIGSSPIVGSVDVQISKSELIAPLRCAAS